mgnify:CR=1 FL=1
MREGTYFARLKTDDVVTSEAKSGNPQVVLKFSVTHFLEGEDWVPIQNVERTLYLPLGGKAWEYTQKKLSKLGFQGDFESPAFVGPAVDTGVSLDMVHETYQNKEKERWDLSGGGAVEKASKDVTRQLNSRWRSEVGSGETAAKAPPAPTGSSVPNATPEIAQRPPFDPNRVKSDPTPPADSEMPPPVDPGSMPDDGIPY